MAEIKVPFHRASITKAEEDAVLEVLRSGWLTTGKYALEFEKKFSEAIKDSPEVSITRQKFGMDERQPLSLAVNSNTSGMILAMADAFKGKWFTLNNPELREVLPPSDTPSMSFWRDGTLPEANIAYYTGVVSTKYD